MLENDNTELTGSLSDESQRNISETDVQPEDEDEELENSLRSQSSSLVELYSSAIGKIGQACYRQGVSNAADSVLRRYRRWRFNRNNLNCTFDIPIEDNSKPKMICSKAMPWKASNSLKRKLPEVFSESTKAALRPPLHKAIHLREWQAQQHLLKSPERDASLRGGQPRPVLVMNFRGDRMSSSEQTRAELEQISPNESLTMSEVSPPSTSSQLREQQPALTVSPTRPRYPTLKLSMEPPLRSNWFSQSPHRAQKAVYPLYAPETSTVLEGPYIHDSPVRQSLLKTRLVIKDGHGGSPNAFPRSPKPESVGSCSKKSRFMSTSGSSPLTPPRQSPAMPPRRLYPQDSCRVFHSQLHSPQLASTSVHHGLKRRFSLDSSVPSSSVSYSPKQLDEEFTKAYHKFVCLGKSSPSKGLPCRMCARGSQASRGHSSADLAALALSPHTMQRKRCRDLDWLYSPGAKRHREMYVGYSPGSQRHDKEKLRRRLCPSRLKGTVSHDLPCGWPGYGSSGKALLSSTKFFG